MKKVKFKFQFLQKKKCSLLESCLSIYFILFVKIFIIKLYLLCFLFFSTILSKSGHNNSCVLFLFEHIRVKPKYKPQK